MVDYVERAQRIADTVLFPAAREVDRTGRVPASHFGTLADEGFYGLAAPADAGGPGLEFGQIVEILETLAGACLTTTFTWMQHHGVVMGLAGTARDELRERYLAGAVSGAVKGGVAFAGAIPKPPRLWAERDGDGYVFDGEAPFVSGWGVIDILQLTARHGDTVVHALVDPVAGPGLAVEELDLVAAQGSNTVRLRFDGYRVPAGRVLAEVGFAEFSAGMIYGSRLNGCVATGLAGRCARLLDGRGQAGVAAGLRAEQASARAGLDAALADPSAMPAARAAASELAYRAAGLLVVAEGSAGILTGAASAGHGQRLTREATFTLVAAGRPEIKTELLSLFGR
ncbi:acyl-CoA dehydrogenase [Amycolatopsis antarctica]|uniref:Acyl-CoA dehydrogenase n=1 Tax=Amycolatopsis antarctica TaxID=1854586 RepID=A0A263D5C1_9PSEU|nr:acyl-CoA dehydrogenase family protein [Amycolatopsis antarctica]OZM73238.1 acyl-CoA dehydrogenase [Amycolatopsis antarctica]